MKMLLKVSFPHEPFNTLVREGRAGQLIEKALGEVKPEAIYFSEFSGKRGCIAIVNVADPSRIPSLAEPFFLGFAADVEFHAVMTPEELGKAGLDEIGKRWK